VNKELILQTLTLLQTFEAVLASEAILFLFFVCGPARACRSVQSKVAHSDQALSRLRPGDVDDAAL
jgi:hypothetical protein